MSGEIWRLGEVISNFWDPLLQSPPLLLLLPCGTRAPGVKVLEGLLWRS